MRDIATHNYILLTRTRTPCVGAIDSRNIGSRCTLGIHPRRCRVHTTNDVISPRDVSTHDYIFEARTRTQRGVRVRAILGI